METSKLIDHAMSLLGKSIPQNEDTRQKLEDAWERVKLKEAHEPINSQQVINDIEVEGKTLLINIWYPQVGNKINTIEVGLMDTRTTDSIQVSYDFERGGWSIKQASKFGWASGDEVCDGDWQEVAYIDTYGRAETDEQENARITEAEAQLVIY